VAFVQGSSLVIPGLGKCRGYAELGYERAIAVMPHVGEILKRHFDLPVSVIPPCLASYFYQDVDESAREQQIALYPKPMCEDHANLMWLLQRALASRGDWRLVELRDMTHREVAAALRRSAFHVNVNCQESFNATVPEAMASGCISVCYEAYGGRDFLRDGENAYVFPNHDLYPLTTRLLELMDGYRERSAELARVRANAYRTAAGYCESYTARALVDFYRSLV
jgi:glycosyltransferase involved in cell wall biosynthesis